MRVESVTIKGFRLFEEATVSLDGLTTIIVGRNNSGKTSFVELFYKFFRVEKVDRFTIDDLSRQQRKLLEEAGNAWIQARKYDEEGNQNVAIVEENRAIGKLPRIMLEVEFSYNDSEPLTPLAELILDLDLKRHDALLSGTLRPATSAGRSSIPTIPTIGAPRCPNARRGRGRVLFEGSITPYSRRVFLGIA